MPGILNKKSRIIDFVITDNGRSQIEDGDIRYKFATFSDRSIIYTKDHEASAASKADISKSEFDYFPIEANSKGNNTLNPEFDLGKFFTFTNSNILDSQEVKNSVNFNAAADLFLTSDSLAGKLKSLSLLSTKNKLNGNTEIKFKDSGLKKNEIDFQNKVNKYKTLSSYSTNKENLPVIALDKRFSHKTNYKLLIPKDISGKELYEKENFQNIDKLEDFNTTGFLYTSYSIKNESGNDEIMSREKEISEILSSIESDNDIHKSVYELENSSPENTFIFELHESSLERNDLEKLSFIKIGNFYDKSSSSTKKVYLIGKIINSRENANDLDTIFSFNNGSINLKNKSTFAISAFYSFVTLFTLVIE